MDNALIVNLHIIWIRKRNFVIRKIIVLLFHMLIQQNVINVWISVNHAQQLLHVRHALAMLKMVKCLSEDNQSKKHF
jgi:hypothetical protein